MSNYFVLVALNPVLDVGRLNHLLQLEQIFRFVLADVFKEVRKVCETSLEVSLLLDVFENPAEEASSRTTPQDLGSVVCCVLLWNELQTEVKNLFAE